MDSGLHYKSSPGGWTALDLGGDIVVHVRFSESPECRLVPTELYVAGGTLDMATLRSIPLGRLEVLVNGTAAADRKAWLSAQGVNPAGLFEAVDWPAMRTVRASVRAVLPAVPEGGRYPDEFYRRVAAAYRALVIAGKAPAPAIAEQNAVPVTTAHRWIKEARRRGFLPPGRKGRAG